MKSIVDYRTIHGSLRKNPLNPSYFTDDSGRAVYLTGSHTWANFQDMRVGDSPPFDYKSFHGNAKADEIEAFEEAKGSYTPTAEPRNIHRN